MKLVGTNHIWPFSPSAVSFLPIQHAGDFQIVALVPEEYTVILSAKSNQRRLDISKLLCIPFRHFGRSGPAF
jgi:hypothetical protein